MPTSSMPRRSISSTHWRTMYGTLDRSLLRVGGGKGAVPQRPAAPPPRPSAPEPAVCPPWVLRLTISQPPSHQGLSNSSGGLDTLRAHPPWGCDREAFLIELGYWRSVWSPQGPGLTAD